MLKAEDLLKREILFPSEVNVRIEVIGLAFCDLNTKISEINFLRYVKHHELSMEIIKKKRNGDLIGKSKYFFDVNSRISVNSLDKQEPEGIYASLEKGEFDLSELVNISELHQPSSLEVKSNNLPLTKLLLHNCTFYTAQMTGITYQLVESIDDVLRPSVMAEEQIGYSLGGKMNFDGNATVIKIEGAFDFEISLPEKDASGAKVVYDIIFDNHCIDKIKCEIEVENDTDFKFYYDILEDSQDRATGTRRKFVLAKKSKLKTNKVPACNVVIRKL